MFLPSRDNQELLSLLANQVDVEYMFHVDCDIGDTQPDSGEATGQVSTKKGSSGGCDDRHGHNAIDARLGTLTDARVVWVTRHFISNTPQSEVDDIRDGFNRHVEKLRSRIDSTVGIVKSGWRINEEDVIKDGRKSDLEFVLFVAWMDTDHEGVHVMSHGGFREYIDDIKECCERVETRCIVPLEFDTS